MGVGVLDGEGGGEARWVANGCWLEKAAGVVVLGRALAVGGKKIGVSNVQGLMARWHGRMHAVVDLDAGGDVAVLQGGEARPKGGGPGLVARDARPGVQ